MKPADKWRLAFATKLLRTGMIDAQKYMDMLPPPNPNPQGWLQ